MDIQYLEKKIKASFTGFMQNSLEIGKALIISRAFGALTTMCESIQISEPYAQLLINIAEREARLREQGKTESQALQALVADHGLIEQLAAHMAKTIEGSP